MCFMPKQPEAPVNAPDYSPQQSEQGVTFKQEPINAAKDRKLTTPASAIKM